MEIKVATGDITRTKVGALIVSHFEGTKEPESTAAVVDRMLDGAISQLIRQKEIRGKPGEITPIYSLGKLPADRVVVVGLGKKAELNLDKVRSAVAETCRSLRQKEAGTIATAPLGEGIGGITAEGSAQAITEGALLGLYSFRKHITKKAEHGEIEQLSIVGDSRALRQALEAGSRKGKILAEATNLARDLVNEPSNYMTPSRIAEVASELASTCGLQVTVLEREQMQEMGMGALLGVAQGSEQPPKFIVLRYKGRDTAKPDVTVIGKGITFDSGGISIKPSEGMGEMKGDMAGGAAMIGALSAIAQLRPRINVMGIMAATENMPSGHALKPGDVLKSMSGKTIEIISTDAEGRLTLADALDYAKKQGSKAIIDLATLTGAMRIALGDICTGSFSNNKELENKVVAAGTEAGERIWPMPMYEEYKEKNKSDVADIQNTGGRGAGAITAAQFLAEFAGDTPWVHLDIAGTSMAEKDRGPLVKGATGVPVRTIVNFVLSQAR
ncbi:MAG: leucyl aminopeptidase [Chloroflexi bacterium]|nr:leucyl aminopeptidase [Chloroflexota bacterium]